MDQLIPDPRLGQLSEHRVRLDGMDGWVGCRNVWYGCMYEGLICMVCMYVSILSICCR